MTCDINGEINENRVSGEVSQNEIVTSISQNTVTGSIRKTSITGSVGTTSVTGCTRSVYNFASNDYVPYLGAIKNVDLGNFDLSVTGLTLSGDRRTTWPTGAVSFWGDLTGDITDQIDLVEYIDDYELLSNKSTNTSLGTSNTLYPTQNAVKTYVDNAVGAENLWDRTGTILSPHTAGDTISAANFSGTSTGDNTGDQTLSSLGAQAQLNGTGFVKATGTTISYDNSTYLTSLSGAFLLDQTTPQTVINGRPIFNGGWKSNADMIIGKGTTRTIYIEAQTTADTQGDSLTIKAADGKGTGAGGQLALMGGQNEATTVSGGRLILQGGLVGQVDLIAGRSGVLNITGADNSTLAGNNNGGDVVISGGDPSGSGIRGYVKIFSDSNGSFGAKFDTQDLQADRIYTFPDKAGTFALTSDVVPAGNNTEVQFNNNGVFGSSEDLTWASNTLTIGTVSGGASTGHLRLANTTAGYYNDFVSSDITAANVTYTLPTNKPGTGLTGFMKSSDAGILSWDTNTYLTSISGLDHNSLGNLTTGDVHTQYLNLSGRAGGQTAYGGTASGDNLILYGSSNATSGNVYLNNTRTYAKPGGDFFVADDIYLQQVVMCPGLTATLAGLGAGNVDNGLHRYEFTNVTTYGESSFSSYVSLTVVDKTTNGQVVLNVPVCPDTRVTARRIYRTKVGTPLIYWYVGEISNNVDTAFTDNIADTSLTVGGITTKDDLTAGRLRITNGGADAPYLWFGSYNTGNGFNTLPLLRFGIGNYANGNGALGHLTDAYYDTANGYRAGHELITGGYNTLDGAWAGTKLTTGNYNLIGGYRAAWEAGGVAANASVTDEKCVYWGAYSGNAGTTPLTNASAWGYYATVGADNTFAIGGVNGGDYAVNTIFGGTTARGKIDVLGTYYQGGLTNYITSTVDGLMKFVGTAGISYGSMYMDDGAVATTLTLVNTYYPITSGLTGGLEKNTTFQNSKEIKILTAGVYKIDWSMSLSSNASDQTIEGVVMAGASGTTAQQQTANSTRAKENGIVYSVSGSGLVTCAVNDLIRLGLENETSAGDTITVNHANLTLMQIGG